jgi:cysteine-rich repeat protein
MRGKRVSTVFALGFVCLLARSGAAQPVGSFVVGDGPSFDTNPPVVTCLEACADLFGGAPADYSCSTSDTEIDHQAWLDGWGDGFTYCSEVPGPESFSVGTNYDCGEVGCSYSAYVADHFCMMTNYCWSDSGPPAGVCGDGTVDANETCDDGNLEDGDCCSSSCQLAPAGSACGDGDACNGEETCSETGECQAGDALDCDDGDPCTQDACDAESGCMAAEAGPAEMCQEASTALLTFDSKKKSLSYDWSGPAVKSQFGDPVASDATAMCLYDSAGSLIGSLAVQPGTMCGRKPCWKSYWGGYAFTDWSGASDGVRWMKLKAGSRDKGHISVGAWGNDVGALGLASRPASGLLAQVVNDAGGCFQTTFKAKDQKVKRGKLTAVKSKKRSHHHGHR